MTSPSPPPLRTARESFLSGKLVSIHFFSEESAATLTCSPSTARPNWWFRIPHPTKEFLEIAERAERMDALRASIEVMRAGKVTPVEDMLVEMEQVLAGKQGR
jgi:hypothetical protein